MKEFGLIGYPLSHSFSQSYFTKKFESLGLSDHRYSLFELPDLNQFALWRKEHPNLIGFNVTIPYKKRILPYLSQLSHEARSIGAVNTVRCFRDGGLEGHNTDAHGFELTFINMGGGLGESALVLGTGGAAAAVAYVLSKHNTSFTLVSRKELSAIDARQIEKHRLIINCTPCGTWPDTHFSPLTRWEALSPSHRVIDLIYNPPKSLLLQQAESRGARICNGQPMLEAQAEAAWNIWNKPFRV